MRFIKKLTLAASLLPVLASGGTALAQGKQQILNVSYDPTREFYQEYNQTFNTYWQDQIALETKSLRRPPSHQELYP